MATLRSCVSGALSAAGRRTTTASRIPSVRTFSASTVFRSDNPPIVTGEGAKPGTVPTDLEQATGLERFELLEKLEGRDPFDLKPLQMTHYGTKSNPIKVWSINDWRIVGCTGYPADSHENLYFKAHKDKVVRCPECGCAYTIDYHGDGGHGHHH